MTITETGTPSPMRLLHGLEALPGRFAAHLAEGLGFSFSHSGLANDAVMARLQVVEDLSGYSDPRHPSRRIRLADPAVGLVVRFECTGYPQHNAVVYGATLENTGLQPIEHVTALRSYDLVFRPLQTLGSPTVHTIGGGVTHYMYPPLCFRLQQWLFSGPNRLTIDSGPTGRSSNKDLPLFYVEDGERTSGIFGGIEWTGLWHVEFARRDEPQPLHYGRLGPNKSFAIRGGMDEVDLALQPGETFHMPRVLLGFYEGTIEQGRNALRRFLSEWAPAPPKGLAWPAVWACEGGNVTNPELVTDGLARAHVPANAQIGVDHYMVGEWLQRLPDSAGHWSATGLQLGTWRPDQGAYPDFKATADFIHGLGVGLGLWFDMEVAHAASEVAREHPEWMLYLPSGQPTRTAPWALVNLALPVAQDWVLETFDRLIADYGMNWIYYDNNIEPRPYWDAYEPSYRRGRLQHDYIRGVWRVWEEVRRRHPDIWFVNCSSGGRRIDLGTLARSHVSQISDQFRYGEDIRYQFSGSNTVIPGDRILNSLIRGFDDYPDHVFHEQFGGMFSIEEDVHLWPDALKVKAAKHIEVYKSIRHLLGKDFYALFPQPHTLEAWDGWQFHDPQTDEGCLIVFRVQSPQPQAAVRLRGLQPAASYRVWNPYDESSERLPGAGLLREGLPIELPLEGSRLLRYSPLTD